MTFTVNVPVGYSLVIASDNASNGTYQQVSDSVSHSPTFMGVNSSIVLGPYTGDINFEITSKVGTLNYLISTSSNTVNAMLTALIASTSSGLQQ